MPSSPDTDRDTGPCLQLQGLTVGYGGRAILPPISMDVAPGQWWAVLGPNGAGKTTWLRTVLGQCAPVAGRVTRGTGYRMAYVPQRREELGDLPARALDLIQTGLEMGWSAFRPWHVRRQGDRVTNVLAETGITHLSRTQFSDLSEGQKQRVIIARALVSGPGILALDEPTSAMDISAQEAIFELLARLRGSRGITVIMTSHNIPLALRHASHILFVDRDREVCLAGERETVIQTEAFRACFGQPQVGSEP